MAPQSLLLKKSTKSGKPKIKKIDFLQLFVQELFLALGKVVMYPD
jgi:hypothetical protein